MAEPIERKELLKRVKSVVQKLSPDAEIILFGSRAKGTARADSDWDFLILVPSLEDKKLEVKIKDSLYEVELETDTVLSSIIRTKQEWMSSRYAVVPLRQQVESDGVSFVSLDSETVAPLVEETAVFINTIRSLLTEE